MEENKPQFIWAFTEINNGEVVHIKPIGNGKTAFYAKTLIEQYQSENAKAGIKCFRLYKLTEVSPDDILKNNFTN